jgi:tetratricopeptide (TPR) repeat protein
VQIKQGNLPGVRDSLAIFQRLTKADPDNAEWQRYLSGSYQKLGNTQFAQGNLQDALASYRAALAIHERWPRPILAIPPLSRISLTATPKSATLWRPRSTTRTRSPPTAQLSPSLSGWPGPILATPAGSATWPQPTRAWATSRLLWIISRMRSPRTAAALPSWSALPRPTPTMPVGSAMSRCPMPNWATCSLRWAIWQTR